MMKTIRNAFYAATLATGLVGGVAAAQAGGLVAVNLGPVIIQDIANDLNVSVSQIPVTVQVPVGVAANVCPTVTAAVLAEDARSGNAECTAESTSRALNQFVQRQLIGQ